MSVQGTGEGHVSFFWRIKLIVSQQALLLNTFFLCASVCLITKHLLCSKENRTLNFRNTLPHFLSRSLRRSSCVEPETQGSSYWASRLHEQLWYCFSVVVVQVSDGQRAMNTTTLHEAQLTVPENTLSWKSNLLVFHVIMWLICDHVFISPLLKCTQANTDSYNK